MAEKLHAWVNAINDPLWGGFVYLLLGVGVFYTLVTLSKKFWVVEQKVKIFMESRFFRHLSSAWPTALV